MITSSRKLHNVKLHNLYSLPVVRMTKLKEGEVSRACTIQGKEDCIQSFGSKTLSKLSTRKTKV